ncbi:MULTISPECIES: MFS transporter [Bacillus]|uniref:MFS transporter n=2 Tax=Bacillus cereus group TaxID=86661 RepID=A0A2C1D1Y0_BACCE|nr:MULTISPECIES: MFS transporter [Bacillus cereus group]OFD75363.1 MFS transporter [Bacillus mycoides]OFD75580.1 MFS transporter [Bacillus mycoides]OFD77468.1 MFS transporter [Bacillus mycoides]PGS93898.1 MFS transporter [Bacillus cereus]
MISEEKMEQHSSSYKWIMLIFATVAKATATLITYGIGVFALFWQQEYALTNMQVGLLISTVNIGPLFCMVFVGRLLDQYSEKILIGMSSVLLGGALLLAHTARGFIGLLFVFLLIGTFYSVSQPGGSKVILKWFPKETRGLAIGIRQAGVPIGGALAGGIIPLLTIKFSLAYTINVIATICIVGGLMFFIFYKESYAREHTSQENVSISFWTQLKKVVYKKTLYPIFITGISMISLQMILIGHFMKFLAVEKSITPILAGKVFSVMLFTGMIGRIILATISDTYYKGDRRTPLFICICISFGLILVFVMSTHTMTLGVLFWVSGLLGFFAIGWFSLFMVEVAESASEESVGLTVSFALTLNQIAIIFAPALFGYIVDGKGYTYAWMSIAALLSVSAVSLCKSKRILKM